MIAAFRSELLLLNRFRMWAIAGLITILFATAASAALVATAEPASGGFQSPGTANGLPFELLLGPGGATAAVSWATFGFGFVIILVAFTSRLGNEFTNGTFRSALLHHPNRWSLIGGKMAALTAIALTLVALGFSAGAVVSAIMAPSQGIDTAGWFGAQALADTAVEFARTAGWLTGWALIATTLAVLIRSQTVALGIGVLWFGPIENVVAEDSEFALRWFPGLLLQQVVSPVEGPVSTVTAATTLGVYGVIVIAVVTFFFKRLDVTS